MLSRLSKLLQFQFRTKEQQKFISALPSLQMTGDEKVFDNVKYLYENRQFLIDCEQVLDFVNRLQNYLLKKPQCTLPHLQCYYKMKEMRLVDNSFKYNIYRKYLAFVTDTSNKIRNQNLEKYLWFLFDENRYHRSNFEEAASLHTVNLYQIYEYMNQIHDLPTWQPYLRVVTMLKYLGHQINPHINLALKRTFQRIQHKYYPYIAPLYTHQQMVQIRKKNKYQQPFLTMLCNEYILKNKSKYDSYLQRVQKVEIQKSYERHLDIMVWSELPTFLNLVLQNHKMNGVQEQIESQFEEIFFRLTEHADIDIETITQILSIYANNPDFMYLRRSSVIERTLESILRQGIQEYAFLSSNHFIELLQAIKLLAIQRNRSEGYQKVICKKIESKRVWDDGELQSLCQYLQKQPVSGSLQALAYLHSLQKQT